MPIAQLRPRLVEPGLEETLEKRRRALLDHQLSVADELREAHESMPELLRVFQAARVVHQPHEDPRVHQAGILRDELLVLQAEGRYTEGVVFWLLGLDVLLRLVEICDGDSKRAASERSWGTEKS